MRMELYLAILTFDLKPLTYDHQNPINLSLTPNERLLTYFKKFLQGIVAMLHLKQCDGAVA